MIRVALILAALLVLGSGGFAQEEEPSGWKRFEHEEFIVLFPTDWTLKKGLPGTVVALISPKSSSSDPFRERVTIGIDTLKGGMEFEEYSRRTYEMLLDRLSRARKINEAVLQVSGEPATELELAHRSHGPERTMRIILINDGNQVLNLMISGEEPEYSRMQEVFNRILNNFALKEPPAQASTP